MSQQGYSIGRDTNVVITLPNGTILRLDKIISFDAKQQTTETTIKGLDGVTDQLRFFEGWAGTIKNERRSSALDDYFATIEANYWAGSDEGYCTIQETKTEPRGGVTQWRYERVLLKYDEAGTSEADKSVSQTISFRAAKRIKQA